MNQYGEIIIYQTEDGLTKINVNMQGETVWLSLDQMADLFQRDKSTISRHIKNVFEERELVRDSTVAPGASSDSARVDRRLSPMFRYSKLPEVRLSPSRR